MLKQQEQETIIDRQRESIERRQIVTLTKAIQKQKATKNDTIKYNQDAVLLRQEQNLKKKQIHLTDEQQIVETDQQSKQQADFEKREYKSAQ